MKFLILTMIIYSSSVLAQVRPCDARNMRLLLTRDSETIKAFKKQLADDEASITKMNERILGHQKRKAPYVENLAKLQPLMDAEIEKLHGDWITRKRDENKHMSYITYKDSKVYMSYEEGRTLERESVHLDAYSKALDGISQINIYESEDTRKRDKLMASVNDNQCYQVLSDELASSDGEVNSSRSSGKEVDTKIKESTQSSKASKE